MITSSTIPARTNGNCDIIDLTGKIRDELHRSGLTCGIAALFVVGSTASLSTVEYEPGLVDHDIKALFEKIAPENGVYQHELTWRDDNGHSHLRATLMGPSLTVPFIDNELTLGAWQQIILIDFDTRPRDRQIICQLIGE